MKLLITLLSVAMLIAGCGAGGETSTPTGQHESPASTSIELVLTAAPTDGARASKSDDAANLLNLDTQWNTWAGESTTITYNGDGGLLIPGDANAQNVVIGVQTFALSLVEGSEYLFDVDSDTTGAAALIFAYDGAGNPIPLSQNIYNAAFAGSPFVFVAPAGIESIAIQVQNVWGAPESSVVSAPALTPRPHETTIANNLLVLAGPWQTWDQINTRGIQIDPNTSFDSVTNQVSLAPPDAGAAPFRASVNGQSETLAPGTYQLSVDHANLAWAAVRIDLVDRNGKNIQQTAYWNTDSAAHPNNISFVLRELTTLRYVSVSSPWGELTQATKLSVSLVKQETIEPEPPSPPISGNLLNLSSPWQTWGQIKANSEDPDPNASYDSSTNRTTLAPPNAGESFRTSANAQGLLLEPGFYKVSVTDASIAGAAVHLDLLKTSGSGIRNIPQSAYWDSADNPNHVRFVLNVPTLLRHISVNSPWGVLDRTTQISISLIKESILDFLTVSLDVDGVDPASNDTTITVDELDPNGLIVATVRSNAPVGTRLGVEWAGGSVVGPVTVQGEPWTVYFSPRQQQTVPSPMTVTIGGESVIVSEPINVDLYWLD